MQFNISYVRDSMENIRITRERAAQIIKQSRIRERETIGRKIQEL